MKTFKNDTTLEKRIELKRRICENYPNRVPIIVSIPSCEKIHLKKDKFLVSKDLSIASFLTELHKHSDIDSSKAIFIFCGKNNVLVPTNYTLGQVYEKYVDTEDGFLYITLTLENTFGTVIDTILDSILHYSGRISRTLLT